MTKSKLIILTTCFLSYIMSEDTPSILIYIDKHADKISIEKSYSKVITSNDEINSIISGFDVESIEPWIAGANNRDCWEDICLNKIYREFFN